MSVIAWLVTRSDVFALRVRDATFGPYRTSVVAGSVVAQTIVALIALVSTTATSWIVGPLASICAVAVAVWAGDTSWYVAVIVSPSRTWRNPSVTGVPKAVRIEPRQISSPPPPLKVTSSPAGSIPDATCTRTEVAEESWTASRTVSPSAYTTRSRVTRPYDASRLPVATRAKGCGPTGTFDPIT